MHYTAEVDILLLKEVAAMDLYNSADSSKVWLNIAMTVLREIKREGRNPQIDSLSPRSVRERTDRLVVAFKAEDREQLKRFADK